MRESIVSLLALAAMLPLAAGHARAEDAAAYVVSYIEVAPAAKDRAADLLKQFAVASRKDTGNLRFEALQRIDRPQQFALLEGWNDAHAQEAHAGSAQTKQFRDALAPLLTAPYDERLHTGLALDAREVRASSSAAIHVVTHVDYIPPKKDEGIAAIKAIADPSRKDAGSLRFDILQQTSRPNHLTLVEVWSDIGALDAHTTAAHIVAFRNTIGPMSGALYDQRLYRALD